MGRSTNINELMKRGRKKRGGSTNFDLLGQGKEIIESANTDGKSTKKIVKKKKSNSTQPMAVKGEVQVNLGVPHPSSSEIKEDDSSEVIRAAATMAAKKIEYIVSPKANNQSRSYVSDYETSDELKEYQAIVSKLGHLHASYYTCLKLVADREGKIKLTLDQIATELKIKAPGARKVLKQLLDLGAIEVVCEYNTVTRVPREYRVI